MELTKRQEKQLNKVFDDPKKLRKWVDQVFGDMVRKCEDKTMSLINQYLDLYSITVAYTLRYVCGFGKKRLPEVMQRIWNNVDSFKDGYLDIDDCIKELKENGIDFDSILSHKVEWRFESDESESKK
jgi:hypothetical protein